MFMLGLLGGVFVGFWSCYIWSCRRNEVREQKIESIYMENIEAQRDFYVGKIKEMKDADPCLRVFN